MEEFLGPVSKIKVPNPVTCEPVDIVHEAGLNILFKIDAICGTMLEGIPGWQLSPLGICPTYAVLACGFPGHAFNGEAPSLHSHHKSYDNSGNPTERALLKTHHFTSFSYSLSFTVPVLKKPQSLYCVERTLGTELWTLSTMDPLSAVANVFAVIQIADRIVALCKAYITGVNDAPFDLRTILIEVGSLKCVLEVVKLLDGSCEAESTGNSVAILEKLRGPLDGCKEAMKSLEALFPSQTESPVSGKRQRLALSLASLAWPFKRDKAFKLLEEIGRHKSTISLGLTTEASSVQCSNVPWVILD
jgi:hypothetical protein